MTYREFLPDSIFTRHIECFWELELLPEETKPQYEVLAPDCTFEIIFCSDPLHLSFLNAGGKTAKVDAGATFLGQKTGSARICVSKAQRVRGIRFKPFALAHLFSFAQNRLNNQAMPLHRLFELEKKECLLIDSLLTTRDETVFKASAEALVACLLRNQFNVDQTFRAQLNYLLDRRGVAKIGDLFAEFGVSKVTLHKHFLHKMGLSPKKVSRIWRLNSFLEQKKKSPDCNLTQLALRAGYYDQAHFIREFRSFFGYSPMSFFRNNSQLLSISQGIISRRFGNQYDPHF